MRQLGNGRRLTLARAVAIACGLLLGGGAASAVQITNGTTTLRCERHTWLGAAAHKTPGNLRRGD